EPKLPREFILDAFADPASVRDVVRGILHTIFFHRYFPTIVPQSHEVLDLTLPYVAVPELETLIDARTAALVRELDSSSSSSGGGRGQVSVQFMEMTRRRKLWYKGGDEEVCWESWTVRVTVAEPRTESERAKVRKAMESTLLANVMKVITSVNTYKDHIPPITIMGANPFPYSITVNQREA
ncbi:hypothetical protein M406DRAFT_233895, partial [Cryphonectria parasitica EP155]